MSRLIEYDDIFHRLGQITTYSHKIKIDPSIKPVSQHLRRIPFSQLDKVDAEIDKLLNDDVIEETPEHSPWVSNLVIVPKPSGDLRVCCDYRDLNKAIIRERFILPKVEDMLHALQGSKYFAKIDAKNGFFQLNLSEECRYLTTFITNKGCFQFKRVPFGLSDISETFQKVMEEILFGLDGVEISIDDVIVHAETIDLLIVRLRKVFKRCRAPNLKLNAKKCEFGLTKIRVLGHIVLKRGIEPDPIKTKAIREAPMPTNVSDLRSFLGICGYMSKFIPNYTNLVEPLRRLTPKDVKWTWGSEQVKSFEQLKFSLFSEPVLACFRLGYPTILVTDASTVGLGRVLLQEQNNGAIKPVAYISRSLSSAENRYSQIQHLAWRLYPYRYQIKHIAGKMNIADSFSRLPLKDLDETTSGQIADEYVKFVVETGFMENCALSLSEIDVEIKKDKTLSKLLKVVQTGTWLADLDLKPFEPYWDEFSVYKNVILRGNRIVVPASLKKRVLKLAHEVYVGIVRTKRLLRTKYFWIGMDRDIEVMIKKLSRMCCK